MYKINRIQYLLLLLLALSACSLIKTTPKKVVCPVPQQSCYPTKWKGIVVDTSSNYRRIADNYYMFESLKNVNSPEDEWSISFKDNKFGVITFSDADEQRIMMLKFNSYNRASVESGVGIPLEGSIGTMSIKDTKVVFSASPSTNNPDDYIGNSDIYIADLQGNILVNTVKLSDTLSHDRTFWDSHPAFSPDKKVVFFASDRKPSIGTDLWFIFKMPDGSWSKAINCGDSINSRCDELTPFVSADGKTLLFASSGHESVGGYDIFSSDISPEFWKLVSSGSLAELENRKDFFGGAKNMRPPLNTIFDELFPSSPGDINESLYYSSNQRQGFESIVKLTGGFDLYVRKKFTNQKVIADNTRKAVGSDLSLDIKTDESKLNIAEIKLAEKFTLKGKVVDAITKRVISFADIVVRNIKSEQKNLGEAVPNTNELELSSLGSDLFYDTYTDKADSSGNYTLNLEKGKDYEVTAQSMGTFYDSYKVRIEKDDTTLCIIKNFAVPEVLSLRINFPTDKYNAPYKYAIDSNGVETNNLWQEEIQNLARNILLSKDRISKIILTGHTDDVGTVAYNEALGMNRVNFVISELIKRGVPAELLEGRSAGKLELLAVKTNESLQLYRKRLRRVEIQKVAKT